MAAKEQVTMANPENAIWFVAVDLETNQVVGCACCVVNKQIIRFKSDYVLPSYRRRGIYQRLFAQRLNYCRTVGVKRVTAFCTPLSLTTYLKNGFAGNGRRQGKDIQFVTRYL